MFNFGPFLPDQADLRRFQANQQPAVRCQTDQGAVRHLLNPMAMSIRLLLTIKIYLN